MSQNSAIHVVRVMDRWIGLFDSNKRKSPTLGTGFGKRRRISPPSMMLDMKRCFQSGLLPETSKSAGNKLNGVALLMIEAKNALLKCIARILDFIIKHDPQPVLVCQHNAVLPFIIGDVLDQSRKTLGTLDSVQTCQHLIKTDAKFCFEKAIKVLRIKGRSLALKWNVKTAMLWRSSRSRAIDNRDHGGSLICSEEKVRIDPLHAASENGPSLESMP